MSTITKNNKKIKAGALVIELYNVKTFVKDYWPAGAWIFAGYAVFQLLITTAKSLGL